MSPQESGPLELDDTQSFEIDWNALDSPTSPMLHEEAVAGVLPLEPVVVAEAPVRRERTLGDLERERFRLECAGKPVPESLKRTIAFMAEAQDERLRRHVAESRVPFGAWFRQQAARLIFRK